MIERRSVIQTFFGTKPRNGIVLEIDGDTAVVVMFYGTERKYDHHVAVNPISRDGIALRLEKPTFFYARNIAAIPLRDCEDKGRRCPPELFERLNALRLRAMKR